MRVKAVLVAAGTSAVRAPDRDRTLYQHAIAEDGHQPVTQGSAAPHSVGDTRFARGRAAGDLVTVPKRCGPRVLDSVRALLVPRRCGSRGSGCRAMARESCVMMAGFDAALRFPRGKASAPPVPQRCAGMTQDGSCLLGGQDHSRSTADTKKRQRYVKRHVVAVALGAVAEASDTRSRSATPPTTHSGRSSDTDFSTAPRAQPHLRHADARRTSGSHRSARRRSSQASRAFCISSPWDPGALAGPRQVTAHGAKTRAGGHERSGSGGARKHGHSLAVRISERFPAAHGMSAA